MEPTDLAEATTRSGSTLPLCLTEQWLPMVRHHPSLLSNHSEQAAHEAIEPTDLAEVKYEEAQRLAQVRVSARFSCRMRPEQISLAEVTNKEAQRLAQVGDRL